MPTSSAPEPRGPSGRRDPVRPATTPPRRRAGKHRRAAPSRAFTPSTAPTPAVAARRRSGSSGPALPLTVWLLTTPAARLTRATAEQGSPERPPSPGSDAVTETLVAEILRHAATALVPTTTPARRRRTTLIIQPACPEVMSRAATAPAAPVPAVPLDEPPRGATTARAPAPKSGEAMPGDLPGVGAGVELVLLDATRTAAAPVALDGVTAVLPPGGVLAVVTTSDHTEGRLRDPRPALIASARAAGLDYWQHIVVISPLPGAPAAERDGDEPLPWQLLADVSVFRSPTRPATAPHPARDPHDTPTTRPTTDTDTTEVQL